MKTNTLALLLTHLTAVMAHVYITTTTTTPFSEQRLQRGTKDMESSFTTSPYQFLKSSTQFRPASRSVRTHSYPDNMIADQSVSVDPNCKQYQREDIFITDNVVSERAASDKEGIIALANELALVENGSEKTSQLIKETLEKRPGIHLIVFSSTHGQYSFYNTGYRETTADTDLNHYSEQPHWTHPTKNCRIGWLFGFYQPIQARKSVIGYFSIRELELSVDEFKIKCNPTSTQCVTIAQRGFQPGGCICVCRPGFYSNRLNFSSNTDNGSSITSCLPCPETCTPPCQLPEQCSTPENHQLRTILFSVQICFMSITFALVIIVFKNRKCKTIASGMWTILELILGGCIILYGTVLIRWFTPSTESCIIEPWCREIGFVICYGAIILKLYRILIEFRTRKAHRWVVRDKDLLKYLLGMFIVVFGYMAAWTANNLDLINQENYSMVTYGRTHDGLSFLSCKSMWWDYVTQTGELLILVFGVHLSYASRNAVSQFQERCFLCMAISVEAVVSGLFYMLRFVYWDSINPDLGLLAYFLRSHLTTTFVIILVLAPKWYFQQELSRCRVSRHYLTQESGRAPFEAFKPQDGVTATGSDVEGEINLAEMNPDDIRAELKRLYTQLEVLKNKTIRFDNPHISKRRGGRKIAHRRFSLQNLKQQAARHAMRHETEAEPSRTPEESICSNEGPSIILNDGPSDILPSTPKKQAK